MIKINDIGYQFVNVGGYEANFPEGSNDYLYLFLRCPAEFNLTGEYEWLPANTIIIFDKNSPQFYRKWDAHFINDWIHFDFDIYDDYFEKLALPLNTPIHIPYFQELQEMTSDILIEYFSSNNNRDEIMAQKADKLFHKVAELYSFSQNNSQKMSNHRSRFLEIRKQIKNRQLIPNNVDEIAASLHLSTSYFQHLYKNFFGVSVYTDIIEARIQQACNLLKRTSYPISEIALLCGYDNFEHFSRIFKKHMGISPRDYRKKDI